jgi:Protein of unknown function (DUF2589)
MPDQASTPTTSNSNFINEAYSNLPMATLIGAPLKAACEANMGMAMGMIKFVKELGPGSSGSGTATGTAQTLNFNVNRPVSGSTTPAVIPVSAPLLSLVPIPSLLVEDVNISFQMEVTLMEKTTTNIAAELGFTAEFSNWFANVNVYGKVTASRENTRSTSQTAKYQVQVSARQQPMTEGMQAVVNLLNSAISPLPTATPAT